MRLNPESRPRSLSVALEPRFGHRDDLDHGDSSVELEDLVQSGEVGRKELLADSLDHLDTDDPVEGVRERVRQRAVVEEVDLN